MSERGNTFDDHESIDGNDPGDAFDDSPSDVNFRRFKIIASAFLIYHLLAVVLPPLSVQTGSVDGPSPLVGLLIRPFAGYGQFLHMDRGYAFFAPDPGPSHLIQAAFTQADGSITEQRYPDRDDQWPRLLYHRHFMLAEFLNEAYFPPGPPDDLFESDPAVAAIWEQRRGRYEYIRRSLIEHLRSENEGREVQILRIEHALPGLQEFVEQPIELNDPRLYNVLLDQPIFSDEMAPAAGTTEEIPAPASVDGAESQRLQPPVENPPAEQPTETEHNAETANSAEPSDSIGAEPTP